MIFGQAGSRDVIPGSKRPWCEAADVVFAISETTRQDLLERFDLPAEKVKVTHLDSNRVDQSAHVVDLDTSSTPQPALAGTP